MPKESDSDNFVRFTGFKLPWLLAAGMLAIYLLTLNHWVSPESLGLVANVSGLNCRPELFAPVTYLVTLPLRWLPASWIPPALNLFAAACAALSMAWLARAVTLLPHDQTEAQRVRLQGQTPLLTLRTAWLPPTVAVLVCGLQLTFWEHAIVGTGEMFDLLLFAYLVRCLLELRLDGNNAWLLRLALVYGLAAANNWAMLAFGPLLFLAAFWAAGANPFRRRFLERISRAFNTPTLSWSARVQRVLSPFNPGLWGALLGCFLTGLSLVLLLPLLASCADDAQTDFWPAVHRTLRTYKTFLRALPRGAVSLLCLTSVLPALFLTIRWGSLTQGMKAADKFAAGMFHGLHGLFLAVCLWAALDLPLSPRRLGVGFPCLPLYYLGALSAGYFTGYFLLVFGAEPPQSRRRLRPLTYLVNRCPLIAVWMSVLIAPGLMLRKNLPYILWSRNGALANYTAQLERCLPPAGAVVLSDGSFPLLCLETTLIRHGQQAAYLPMDVSLLAKEPSYFEYLRRQHPEYELAPPLMCLPCHLTNPPVLMTWLEDLASARAMYYLHPVFNSVGESFSVQTRGLFYQLKACSTNGLDDSPLPPEVLAENRAFWRSFAAGPMADLVRRIPPPEEPSQLGLRQRLLQAALGPEPDRWAATVGGYYALALNSWGVELQEAGLLGEAADCFAGALRLNPDNAAAQINREFNHDLQAHKPALIQSAQQIDVHLGKRRSWNHVLGLDGPIDEPSICYRLGTMLADAGLPRQAVRQLRRAQTLAPGQGDVALRLAEQLIKLADYTNALAAANQALQLQPQNPKALFLKGSSLVMLKDYEHALIPLNEALTIETNSPASLWLGWAHFQTGDLVTARQDFERAAQSVTNACQAYYGLAEVAYLERDIPAAIKYGELCQSNTPPDYPKARSIGARLAEMRRGTAEPLPP